MKGVWIVRDTEKKPDVVVYYIHGESTFLCLVEPREKADTIQGGGFAMGSSYFYLEFLLSWVSVLVQAGYQNPAIFALDYSLVPDACFPTQLHQAVSGYRHVLTVAEDPSRVCVSGDSAGAMLILSLLLDVAKEKETRKGIAPANSIKTPAPALAVLISPWATLLSPRHVNTKSDYLDAHQIHLYGLELAGGKARRDDPLLSPGSCQDLEWWRAASPLRGFFITYGEEEILAGDIRLFSRTLQSAGINVQTQIELGGIHAWPVASLFLSSSTEKRLRGLRSIARQIREMTEVREKGKIAE